MLVQTFLPPEAPAHFAALLAEFPSLAMEAYHGRTSMSGTPTP